MRYPCLVKQRDCKTEVTVKLNQEGISKYGEPTEGICFVGKCNYQDTAKTVLTAEKKLIQLSGVALFPGDIAPELPTLSGGTLIVHGVERTIYQGKKARNPDSSVNYCELDVM